MQIIMPTYGRMNDQRTLKNVPPSIAKRIHAIVRLQEYQQYYKLYEQTVGKIISLPVEVDHYGKTIKWILENYKGKILILDDDLRFAKRISTTDYHLRNMNDAQHIEMFEKIDNWLEDYAHVSVSAREGNNRMEEFIQHNCRYMRVLGYNLNMFKGVDISRYDWLQTFVDFDLNLQLLKLGKKSLVTFEYANGHKSSNADGGCSTHRTMAIQEECARKMVELHSPFVKLVEKTTKQSWNGQKRYDVTVQWKKAFNSARSN